MDWKRVSKWERQMGWCPVGFPLNPLQNFHSQSKTHPNQAGDLVAKHRVKAMPSCFLQKLQLWIAGGPSRGDLVIFIFIFCGQGCCMDLCCSLHKRYT